MKRTILIVLAALFIGCASTPVVKEDVCEQIARDITIDITVLYEAKDWDIYFVTVGGKLARNMALGLNECVEVYILHNVTNQELKGFYCMDKKEDGWYITETICEYTQGKVTDRSIGVARKLTP